MSWGERTCYYFANNCPEKPTMATCNVDCKSYRPKQKRICSKCDKQIGRHDKYFTNKDGGLEHRNCEMPEFYKIKPHLEELMARDKSNSKKEEFEKKFLKTGILIKPHSDRIWTWIENEIRQARVDENYYGEKEFRTSNFPNRRRIQEYFRNRIKELEK